MRLEYDREVDAAYLYVRDAIASGEVAHTVPLDPSEIDGEINLDFDRDGKLVGVEIQAASRFLDPWLLGEAQEH